MLLLLRPARLVSRTTSRRCIGRRELALGLGFVAVLGCRPATTATLSADIRARLASEGIVRQADDLTFRYTVGAGRSNAAWEDRRASIVVTHSSVLIHKNAKVGVDARTGDGAFTVERAGNRIRIRTGKGRAGEVWSFEPPADASGWAGDIRAAIRPR